MQKFTFSDYLKYTKELNQYIVLSDISEEYELKKIHQPQDKGYKLILENKEEVTKFINKVLGIKYTKNEIKPKELENCNTSFITKSFREKRADIIYKKKEENIFYLIEHQSTIDYEMPYRILNYCIEITRKSVKKELFKNKNYKTPIIYPIVLYTGKRQWNISNDFRNYQMYLKDVHRVNFTGYNFVDVNNYTEEELWNEDTLLSKMLLLEKAKKQKNVIEYLKKLVKQKITKEEMYLLMEMIYNAKDVYFEEIKNIVEKLKNEKGDEVTMLTPLQEYVEELNKKERKAGRAEGRAEAKTKLKKVVKNMLKNNMSDKLIKQITEISQKELEEIKQM